MALIRSFEARPMSPPKVHAPVTCGYHAVELEGRRILQLETYGTSNRVMLNQPSQKLQLDVEGARELKRILESSFPDL